MSQNHQSICKWPWRKSIQRGARATAFAALAVVASSCATKEPMVSAKPIPRERVFSAPFEDVERALKQAMIKYPPKVENSEAGIFDSDYVKGEHRFRPPHKDVRLSNGYRYRILVRLVRGQAEGKDVVKVVVTKVPQLQRDFFAEPETIGTDGLEEEVILYRVQRELAIDRAVRRAQERLNQQERPAGT